MRRRHISVTALLLGAAAAGPAGAEGFQFQFLECELLAENGWFENGYEALWTYRMYAHFSTDDGHVLAVLGLPDHPLALDTTGDGFFNDPLGGNTAPVDLRPADLWSNQWDSYVTIGAVVAAGDRTVLSPGFGAVSNDLAEPFTTESEGWFTPGPVPQGRPVDGRVLLFQLTVACDEAIFGTFNLHHTGGCVEDLAFFCHPDALPAGGPGPDCNRNCRPDVVDILLDGYSRDCDGDGIPDECEDQPCLSADLDCSGAVATVDLLELLGVWGPCGVCDADLDFNGAVDVLDLLALLASWGACR